MSQNYTISSSLNWNIIGSMYGIDPDVLAKYNDSDYAINDTLPPGSIITIPNAQELVDFYEQLPAPFRASQVSGPTLSLNELPHIGKPEIVAAARMRRLSHASDNYIASEGWRSPIPGVFMTNLQPDEQVVPGTSGLYKCNLFVADSIYAAGYEWPWYQNNQHPVSPGHILLLTGDVADTIWTRNEYRAMVRYYNQPAGHQLSDEEYAEYRAISQRALADRIDRRTCNAIQPGDVMVLHGGGHSAIITSEVEWRTGPNHQDEEYPYVRIIDIYGEHWECLYDDGVNPSGVLGIIRPNKRIDESENIISVGGNPNKIPVDNNDYEVFISETEIDQDRQKMQQELLSNGFMDHGMSLQIETEDTIERRITYNELGEKVAITQYEYHANGNRQEILYYDAHDVLERQIIYNPLTDTAREQRSFFDDGSIEEQVRWERACDLIGYTNAIQLGLSDLDDVEITVKYVQRNGQNILSFRSHMDAQTGHIIETSYNAYTGTRSIVNQYDATHTNWMGRTEYFTDGTIRSEMIITHDESNNDIYEEREYSIDGQLVSVNTYARSLKADKSSYKPRYCAPEFSDLLTSQVYSEQEYVLYIDHYEDGQIVNSQYFNQRGQVVTSRENGVEENFEYYRNGNIKSNKIINHNPSSDYTMLHFDRQGNLVRREIFRDDEIYSRLHYDNDGEEYLLEEFDTQGHVIRRALVSNNPPRDIGTVEAIVERFRALF